MSEISSHPTSLGRTDPDRPPTPPRSAATGLTSSNPPLRAIRHHYRAVEPGDTRPTTGRLDHPEHRKENAQQPRATVSSQPVTHTKDPG
jgi:hypothetical protein